MGSSAVGKTSIVVRYSQNVFSGTQESTIGAAFVSRDVDTANGTVLLHIWDTAGQELYRSLVPRYSHGASAIIIVFDVTDEDSFKAAKDWLQEARETNGDKLVWVLVGNKCDLKPGFDLAKAENFAQENGMFYIETSAKTGENVEAIFNHIALKVPKLLPVSDPNSGISLDGDQDKGRQGCCG